MYEPRVTSQLPQIKYCINDMIFNRDAIPIFFFLAVEYEPRLLAGSLLLSVSGQFAQEPANQVDKVLT
ncbi:hypothetical protein SDC9_178906 [bioreactor metagenome]|uniref:Uncharacterized protein n=1 Tax=bioreactor metagenome TaxID=1076179 RepID=A0A645GZF6_9ZZZZ